MDLCLFASRTITNIWAGIGARMWAVSHEQATNIPSLAQKALRMPIGALGLFYCSETHSFTTPFLVYSPPQEGVVVDDVWPEQWTLPFRIHPLGTPRNQLHKDEAQNIIPTLSNSDEPWTSVFFVQPTTVFVPSQITSDDWQILIQRLAE